MVQPVLVSRFNVNIVALSDAMKRASVASDKAAANTKAMMFWMDLPVIPLNWERMWIEV